MKERSFLYGLLKFIEWFAQRNSNTVTEIDNFSTNNNFSPLKLKLLPYFLCTANGNRDAMFTIFDSFYAGEEGYMENDLNDILIEGKSILNVLKIENRTLTIVDKELFKQKLFKEENKKLVLSDDAFIEYFELKKSFKPTTKIETSEELLKHITHSIESLRKQDYYNEGGVLDLSEEKLSTLSSIHFMYKLHKRKVAKYEVHDGKERIKIEYLLPEKSVFGENPRDRIHTPIFELMGVK